LNAYVTVGERTVIHTAASLPTGFPARVEIGMNVVLQNSCTLYSCTVGNEVLVGHRSIVMEGAKLEDGCAIGPNSVVPPGRIIPSNQLWAGNPVQYIRDLEKVVINT
jgi:carbonic anhydrase/acetyltransferase-like protein (isoleucine patch superfamily)